MAYKSLPSDVRTGKRAAATLVWELEDPSHTTIDCFAMTNGNGLVRLSTDRGGVREELGIFPDARTAVRTAFDLERTLISDGWAKVV